MAAPTRFAPAALADGLVLTGTGERVVKIGFVVVNVYSAAFYVDAAAASVALRPHVGRGAEELGADAAFRRELVEARADKAVRITMCRGVGRAKMVEAFGKSLGARVSEQHAEAARGFVDALIPEAGLSDNNVLLVRLSGDGETLECSFQEHAEAQAAPLATLASGGAGGVWEGFQSIYFDDRTELPDVRRGFLQGLPSILAAKLEEPVAVEPPPLEAPSELGERAPSVQVLARTRSWKSASGRKGGRDSYVVGDLTRTVWAKLHRKERGSYGSVLAWQDESTDCADSAELACAQEALTEARAELSEATRKLQQVTARLGQAEQRLQAARGSPVPRVILVGDALGLSLAFLALLRRRTPGGRRVVAMLLVLSLAASGYLFSREQSRARMLHKEASVASS